MKTIELTNLNGEKIHINLSHLIAFRVNKSGSVYVMYGGKEEFVRESKEDIINAINRTN
jgi:uncharacterized protein YlzI (FlbEa/FlbD family)